MCYSNVIVHSSTERATFYITTMMAFAGHNTENEMKDRKRNFKTFNETNLIFEGRKQDSGSEDIH